LFVVLSESKQTLPLGLATTFKDDYQTVYNQLMAISLIALAPTYIVFLFFQRQFVEGITLTGIKG
jgi:multiple sugar transport system permease protein